MPRNGLEIQNKVETLSILDENGKVDADLVPKLSDDELRKLYASMLTSRRLDERCLMMQRQGRLGTYGPCKGQEATPLGFAFAMRQKDWLAPSYRELAAFVWRGWPLENWLLWWGGHEAGAAIPEGINDLPICVPIASQCQYAMGVAWASKLRKDDAVCVCFIGDGGTSQGDFHEAMNFATVYKVPLVMVVQNNHWAISLPRSKQTASPTFAHKALAYGMDGLQIDGNDILAVVSAAREAIDKARNGGGPSLIEAVTYRIMMHTTADEPKKYRDQSEVEPWLKRCPLTRFAKYLRGRKLLDDKIEQVIEEEVKGKIDAAVEAYESYEHKPYEFFEYMYEEMPPELLRQRAELRKYRHDDEQPADKPEVSHA